MPSIVEIKDLLHELRLFYRANKIAMDRQSRREYWSVFHSLSRVASASTSSRAATVYRNTVLYLQREMWLPDDMHPQ